jgi:putative exporter of polyketide antibiotics
LRAGDGVSMLHPLIHSLVKIAVASLIVGTILAHFGITAEQLVKEFGLSYERIEDLARRGASWAAPNLLVGAMVILPVWFLMYLFRPPGGSSQKQD